MHPKTIFLDTNIFLHYQPFEQINWPELLNASEVKIIIPPVIIRELNKKKDGDSDKNKRRASKVLKKLNELFELESISQLREKTIVLLEDREPLIDFTLHHLNKEIEDDNIIASILMCLQDNDHHDEVILITSDAGLSLLGKARRQSINIFKMPESFKAREEIDPNLKIISEQEQEIKKLKLRIPKLTILFENKNTHLEFQAKHHKPFDRHPIDQWLSNIEAKYPKMALHKDDTKTEFPLTAALASLDSSFFLTGQVKDYNDNLDKYFSSCEKYFIKMHEFDNFVLNKLELQLYIANDGNVPAHDIDVFLIFQEGYKVFDQSNIPQPPEEPKAPSKPQPTNIYSFLDSSIFSQEHQLPAGLLSQLGYPKLEKENISSPFIRKNKDHYEVQIHVKKLKHNIGIFLDPLFVYFNSSEHIKSFHIEYRIICGDIPTPIDGKLHVKVTL